MDERTLTALYDTRGGAEAARDELTRLGVPSDNVSIRGSETGGGADATAAGTAGEGRGFWDSLSDLFMPDEDRHTYAEGLRRGGYLLTARVPAGLEDEAIAVLERSGPVDIDERSASWRESGWTGQASDYSASAGASTGAGATAAPAAGATAVLADEGQTDYQRTETTGTDYASGGTAADYGTAAGATTGALGVTGAATGAAASRSVEGEERIPVVEEQLRVDKREVDRGSVRVRSYVREIPVEEQVELRQERVSVERRPVDRELAPGEAAAAFQERSIEVVARGEEAVVSKSARVVEEIAVRKDVERETETVRDTVHRTEVDIEDDRGLAAGATTGGGTGTTAADAGVVGSGPALDPDPTR